MYKAMNIIYYNIINSTFIQVLVPGFICKVNNMLGLSYKQVSMYMQDMCIHCSM